MGELPARQYIDAPNNGAIKMPISNDLSLDLPRQPIRGEAHALAKDFIAFVRKPTRGHPHPADVKTRVRAILTLLALNALFTLLVCLPMLLVLHRTIGLDARPDLLGIGGIVFSGLVFAPVVEELMFRAGLRSARWASFGMPVIGSTFASDWRVTLPIAGLAATVWLIGHVQSLRLLPEARTARRWKQGRGFIRHYAAVVWISAALFGVIHLANFVADDGLGWKNIFLILAVVSQCMSGMVLSYLRLRYGLRSSMAAHFGWNLFVIGLSFL
jgi:membrane protease YdiL (CAAX protease family)